METALTKAGGKFTYLANELDLGRRAVSNYFKLNRAVPLGNLRKIMVYLGLPLETASDKITKIGKLTPHFPFNLHSVEGAEIRAAFLSDGHIDKGTAKHARYHACERKLHLRLINLCKTVFGAFETRTTKAGNYYNTHFPAAVAFALSLCGVPAGNKGRANPFLPKDILLGSEKIQSAYLRRVFDDEGDVCFENKSKRAVRLSRSYALSIKLPLLKGKWLSCKKFPPSNLIVGEYLLLKKMIPCKIGLYPEGIYRAVNNQITAKHRIQLTQRDNLKEFYNKIGFNLAAKNKKLKKALDSYKITKFQNGDGLKFVLEKMLNIYAQKGEVKFSDVSSELVAIGRCQDLAGLYLKKLVDMKVLIKVKRGVYVFKRNSNNRWLSRRSSVKDLISPCCPD